MNTCRDVLVGAILFTDTERFDQSFLGLIINEFKQFRGIVLHECEVVVEAVNVHVTQRHVAVGEDCTSIR